MYRILKAKYFTENKRKHNLLESSFNMLLRETKQSEILVETVYNEAYHQFKEHFKLASLEPGSSEFLVFESYLFKSILLTASCKKKKTSESTVSGDVAVYLPPLGSTQRRKDVNPNKIPTFECTWKEFTHFMGLNKDKSNDELFNDFLADKEIDDEFKMELLKTGEDNATYLKYFDYLVKLTKNKKG